MTRSAQRPAVPRLQCVPTCACRWNSRVHGCPCPAHRTEVALNLTEAPFRLAMTRKTPNGVLEDVGRPMLQSGSRSSMPGHDPGERGKVMSGKRDVRSLLSAGSARGRCGLSVLIVIIIMLALLMATSGPAMSVAAQ